MDVAIEKKPRFVNMNAIDCDETILTSKEVF